ncbi:MAG: glycine--tRNA ligase subunit beta [Thermodesulfovibrionales bacterium]
MNAENQALNQPLLLEIGTEEIPARFLPGAISDLARLAGDIFSEYRITHGEIKTFATPRRLALLIQDIAPMQKDNVKEVFGPSKKAAYDQEGRPTKAAEGFAASLGLTTSALIIKQKGKADYVAAVVEEKGVETKAVLPEMLKKMVLSLRFPKNMRWGEGGFSFVRPIHWIVSLYGVEVIDITIDTIKSGGLTRGHRFLSPAAFQVRDIASYISMLENNFVLLDQDRRKKSIREGILALAAGSGGHPVMDEELLDLVNFLVEYPVPVLCSFNTEYLKLPKELLITVMKDHQKYFAIQDDNGNLMNSFIVISNTRAENRENVRIGAERVIKARFDDAKFYFHEDRKRPLIDRLEDLRKVTFHDALGSLFAKTDRMAAIAGFLGERIRPRSVDLLDRTVRLSKADLITGVVREFPELQGIMGKYYAALDGERPETAAALEEQYLPKAFGDRLPATDTGAILSLSDKIDNLTAFFAIGQIPTGSEDPFALRRQAMGVVSLLIDRGYELSLREIIGQAFGGLAGIKQKEGMLDSLMGFMEQRTEFILSSLGHDQEIIRSVLPLSSVYPLRDIIGRIRALEAFKTEPVFPDFLLAIKRVNNIIPKTALPAMNGDLFSQAEEKDLFEAFSRLREQVAQSVAEKKFHEGLIAFSGITTPVNNFFDKVLVMDKDEAIKLNRLSLLNGIWSAVYTLADFSKLT